MKEPVHAIINAPAGEPHKSNDPGDAFTLKKPVDLGRSTHVSLEIKWRDLVGYSTAKQLVGWVSITGADDGWDDKTRLEFSFNSAQGCVIIPLAGVVCEQFLKLEYDPTGITAGTINVHVYGK